MAALLPGSSEKRAKAMSALHHLFSRQPLAPLDKWMKERRPSNPEDTFLVPLDFGNSPQSMMSRLLAGVAAIIYQCSSDLFPPESWPVTLARESVLAVGGNTQYTDLELRRVYDAPETGPLGFLATAGMLYQFKSVSTPAFTTRGLERLSAEDFRKDARLLLLESGLGLQGCLNGLLAGLRELKPEEVTALGEAFMPEHPELFGQLARDAAAKPGQPASETLAPWLDQWWEKNLRLQVESALRQIASNHVARVQREAPFEIGLSYFKGEGVAKNYPEAVKWFQKAAERGHPGGIYMLAICYDNGLGVAKDFETALKLLRQAAEVGVIEAQVKLGEYYSDLFSEKRDDAEAWFWFTLAAENGNKVAGALRKNVERKLTPEQLAEAQKRFDALKVPKK